MKIARFNRHHIMPETYKDYFNKQTEKMRLYNPSDWPDMEISYPREGGILISVASIERSKVGTMPDELQPIIRHVCNQHFDYLWFLPDVPFRANFKNFADYWKGTLSQQTA